MELYQIKSFVMVAQTGNLTRAAEKLNTTPPSVSNHIKQLEEKYKVSLFTRTPRGMKITSQGKLLEQKARAILDAVGQFSRAANCLEQTVKGFLNLGINADSGYLKIPLILNHLFQQYPDLRLEIIPSNTGDVLKGVEQGAIDCGYAFGIHDHPKLEFCDLARDDITKTAFINQGIGVTVLEKKEAAAFADTGKIFIWNGHDPIQSRLFLVYSKQRTNDLLVKTLASVIRDIWAATAESFHHRSYLSKPRPFPMKISCNRGTPSKPRIKNQKR